MKEGNEARNENIRRMFSRTAGLAVGLIYPRRCPICDKPVKPAGGLICAECSGIPVRISGPACRKCGKPLRDGNAEYCDDCIRQRHVFESGAAVFRYRSVQNAIYRFKYSGRAEYAVFFGREMAIKLESLCEEEGWRPDVLVPVPIHRERLQRRGYNQAELLSREITKRTHIPTESGLLFRTKNTKPLKSQSVSDRKNSLNGAFTAISVADNSKSIIIVDDIFTTGATIDACAGALYGAGAHSVHFLTLAIGALDGWMA